MPDAVGRVTLITSERPATLGKTYAAEGGKLTKTTAGQLVSGMYEVRRFSDAQSFAVLLASVTTSQALTTSLPANGSGSGRLVSKAMLAANPGAVARTKADFGFFEGQRGVLTLDYDPPASGALSRDDLWASLLRVAPAVASASVVWWCSGSSHIHVNGVEVQALKGQRLFILIEDASDTKRAFDVLKKRLWLAGLGSVLVGGAGSLLMRCLFDEAMAQPARLDFIGGAVCGAGVEQRRGAPQVLSDGGWLNTREALPNLSASDEGRYEAMLQEARAAKRGEAEAARAAWKSKRVAEGLPVMMAAGASASEAEARIAKAVDAAFGGVLLGDFPLTVVNEDGTREQVTVEQVLRHRDLYHERDALDPLNPGHRGGEPDCRLFLMSSSPIAYSLDDGGQVWRLRRQVERLEFGRGSRSELVAGIVAVLGEQDDVFRTAAGLVQVVDGRPVLLTSPRLQNLVGSRVALFQRSKGNTATPADLSREVAELVLAELS